MNFTRIATVSTLALGLVLAFLGAVEAHADEAGGITVADVMRVQNCTAAEISPDGRWIAYTLSVPRGMDEEAGSAYSELHVVETATGRSRPFVTGKVNVRSPQWSPDGTRIAFLTRRAPATHTQVWALPLDGGEAQAITRAESNVLRFRWHPDGSRVLYIATTPAGKTERDLARRGFDFVFFEENLSHRNLYVAAGDGGEIRQLTQDITVWEIEVSPDGRHVAFSATEKNLVDHEYMFKQIHILDLEAGEARQLTRHQGKLEGFAFSPDSKHVAFNASRDMADHAASQAWVIPTAGGDARNLTAPDFPGHVNWMGWQDNRTLLVHTSEGVWNHLRTAPLAGGAWGMVLDGAREGVVFRAPSTSRDGSSFALLGTTPDVPSSVYTWTRRAPLRRLTDHNPWLAQRRLARQEVIRYPARDGVEIEGLLVYPLDYEQGKRYPLIVSVHGGPEAHHSNGWLTPTTTRPRLWRPGATWCSTPITGPAPATGWSSPWWASATPPVWSSTTWPTASPTWSSRGSPTRSGSALAAVPTAAMRPPGSPPATPRWCAPSPCSWESAT